MLGSAIARAIGRGGPVLLDLGGRRRLLTMYLFICLAAFTTWLPATFLLFDLPLFTSFMCALAVSSLAALVTLPMAYVGNGQIREGGVISADGFTPWDQVLRYKPWEQGISLTVTGTARGLLEITVELTCSGATKEQAARLIAEFHSGSKREATRQ